MTYIFVIFNPLRDTYFLLITPFFIKMCVTVGSYRILHETYDMHKLPQQHGKLPAFILDYEVLAAGTFSNKTIQLAFGISYVFYRAFSQI